MRRTPVTILLSVVCTLAVTALLPPLTSVEISAQEQSCRQFSETDRTLCGRFLTYWQKNGGLPTFGLPITNEFVEISKLNGRPYVVQYFERSVFEMHPENNPPNDVQLALLGVYTYNMTYPTKIEGSVPTYPNAQNIKVELLDPQSPNVQVTTFQTRDTPGAILTFYKEALQKQGWSARIESPSLVSAGYSQETAQIRVFYDLKVEIVSTSNGTRNVQIFFRRSLPR